MWKGGKAAKETIKKLLLVENSHGVGVTNVQFDLSIST